MVGQAALERRFARGVDPASVVPGLELATRLILDYARNPRGPDSAVGLSDYIGGGLFSFATLVLLLVMPLLTMRLFAEERKTGSLTLLLASPAEGGRRGSQVCLAFEDGHPLQRTGAAYPVVQALIARGVVGDFRAGNAATASADSRADILRFGVTPLYTRFVDVWDAVGHLQSALGADDASTRAAAATALLHLPLRALGDDAIANADSGAFARVRPRNQFLGDELVPLRRAGFAVDLRELGVLQIGRASCRERVSSPV